MIQTPAAPALSRALRPTGPNGMPRAALVGLAVCLVGDVQLANAEVHVWLPAASTYRGEGGGSFAGSAVAGAGDVNGDGFDDVLVGDYQNADVGVNAGKAYLVFGHADPLPPAIDLGQADVSFTGESPGDWAGYQIGGVGDVNDDGYEDLAIVAPRNDEGGPWTGQTYLLFGKPNGWAQQGGLELADASLQGVYASSGMSRVAAAGDVNGDGIDDMLIGCQGSGVNGENAGQVYLIFGRTSGWAPDLDVGIANASFLGEAAYDYSGRRASAAGDIDGDGIDDIVLDAPGNSESFGAAGQVYLMRGRAKNWSLATSLGETDASFLGEAFGDQAGFGIGGHGDLDGDGLSDLVIGARFNDHAGEDAGKVYLILGREYGMQLDTPLEQADASFTGESPHDSTGWELAIPGDINGDGLADAIASAPAADTVYVILGRSTGWAGVQSIDTAGAAFGGHGWAGWSIDGAGDVNGDGLADFIVGAPYADGLGIASLVLGSTCWDSDGDGTDSCSGDCDDLDASVNPEAEEVCDGLDNDCSGSVPADELDADGDGVMACAGDCDDGEPASFPGNPENCDDGIDNDCDGDVDLADDECEDAGDDDSADDDTADDDSQDDDTTEPPGGDCECRSQTAPGGAGSLGWLLLLAGAVGRKVGRAAG